MRKSICFVVAIPLTAQSFLRDHIRTLSHYYDIYLIGNITTPKDVDGLELTGWHQIKIERSISPWKDLKSIFQCIRYFKEMKFDAVHSVTPKAGMVTAIASKVAGIMHRTHIFTGQVWATRQGIIRGLLKYIDKMIARLDNHILVDGKSQRAFLIKEGVLREGQAVVFGQGSISGVNAQRFAPNPQKRKEIRDELGIADNTVCFVFLGRLNHDKGISELLAAYDRMAESVDKTFLLLIGSDEDGYMERINIYHHIIEGDNFCYYGVTRMPEEVLNAGDVFVLPTYREGFGTSVLESACMGMPCICSDAYGVLDSFIEGETGLKCQVGDVDSLYSCMKKIYDNPEMRVRMGVQARERAIRDFNGENLTRMWVSFYHKLLESRTIKNIEGGVE